MMKRPIIDALKRYLETPFWLLTAALLWFLSTFGPLLLGIAFFWFIIVFPDQLQPQINTHRETWWPQTEAYVYDCREGRGRRNRHWSTLYYEYAIPTKNGPVIITDQTRTHRGMCQFEGRTWLIHYHPWMPWRTILHDDPKPEQETNFLLWLGGFFFSAMFVSSAIDRRAAQKSAGIPFSVSQAETKRFFWRWLIGSLAIFSVILVGATVVGWLFGESQESTQSIDRRYPDKARVLTCERGHLLPFRTYIVLAYEVQHFVVNDPISYQSRLEVRGIGCESLVGHDIRIKTNLGNPATPTIAYNKVEDGWFWNLMQILRWSQMGSALWFIWLWAEHDVLGPEIPSAD